jgi:hypothetical protein
LPVIDQLHIISINLFIKTYIGAFVKRTLKSLMNVTILAGSLQAFALPIDWNGTLGFDQHIIKNARRSGDACTPASGSQCLKDESKHARFQSMLLKLQPTIIVNDSTSIKGELSTGTSRGGFLGDNIDGTTSGSYFGQTSSGSSLNINQFYAELYADTALFRVGKFAKHYGLGAVISSGNGAWDRYFSAYDGIEAEFKLGNFKLTPVMAKLNNSVTSAGPTTTAKNGKYDTNESSVTAMYDNSNKNLKAGVFYGQREVETNSDLYGSGKGSQKVTIIDIFFEKSWGDFNLAMEIPMLSGDAGTTYGSTSKQDFDARAYIVESSYQVNPRWKLGLNAGFIGGSDDDQGSQEALYLHPNYKIAEIMFNYNLAGFQNSDTSIFNASVVNTNYTRLFAHYSNDAWSWRFDFIMATANEAAKNGSAFYSHESQSYENALADQDTNLGMEFDAAFDYEWSPSIVVTGYVAHYQVGDYYAFTNTSTELSVSDVTATGFKLNIGF